MHDRVKNAKIKCAESLKEHERLTKEIEIQFQEREKSL